MESSGDESVLILSNQTVNKECSSINNNSTMEYNFTSTMKLTTPHEEPYSVTIQDGSGGAGAEVYVLVFEYILCVEYLVCFLVNLLTITAVAKFRYLHRKPTNILILSLSIADGCLGRSEYLF